ncbi:MAG: putative basic amino acid antiporter YfcC [Lewinellaceae bacterium]|nr:YfcC family protein [Saprospiraceae bacterium]MCB9337412.1 putative basic amino acid antiporter YfcC [Lewinellaceae bacterium]
MIRLKKFPDTLLILLVILGIFILLTWILPAGEFERSDLGGRTVVVPGTYARVEQQPQGIGDFLMAPILGFVSAAQIIAFVFMVGGAFSILARTGAIDAGLQAIVKTGQQYPGRKKWIIPVLVALFSLAGATFGMSEEVLVFVLITIPLSLALGYDSIVGVSISFVGAGTGFAGAFINPFTIGIAQGIAELPPFSGIEYRMVVWAVLTLVSILFLLRYARRIEKDPLRSTVYELDRQRNLVAFDSANHLELTLRRKLTIGLLFVALAVLVVGVSRWDWYIDEITGLFIAMGILAAIFGGLSAEKAVAAFQEGARDMMVPALVIALAKGLIVVASEGKIIDTLLNSVASAAGDMPPFLSAEIMFVVQSFLNFFVPSGSGQAALTMPIMAPLSDLLGISRQVAVLAFQFGDGLSNLVIPTSGVTMGVLAIAKIRYDVWLKWMLPLFILLSLVAMLLLALPVLFFNW